MNRAGWKFQYWLVRSQRLGPDRRGLEIELPVDDLSLHATWGRHGGRRLYVSRQGSSPLKPIHALVWTQFPRRTKQARRNILERARRAPPIPLPDRRPPA